MVFDGGSFVVDADGTLLERSPMFMEDLTFWDFDAAADHQTKSTIVAELDPDEEVYTACVLGLKDYMAKNHFNGVTLGLSGGIDSALVATMAADACGGENVWGISKTMLQIWPPTSVRTMRFSPLSRCSSHTSSSLISMAWPQKTCRLAFAASS